MNTASISSKISDTIIQGSRDMSAVDFYNRVKQLATIYRANKQTDEFCKEAQCAAENFIQVGNNDFAGIIISTLCKLTEFMPAKLEGFAQKGYDIAKSNNDYIHMMARLNDLRKVYFRRPEKLYNYIQVLYKQEKCLKQITNHYEECEKSYKSVNRKIATKKDYELMLAHIQTEIGKLTKKRHPQDALNKLLSARELFIKNENTQHLDYINMLIEEAKRLIS